MLRFRNIIIVTVYWQLAYTNNFGLDYRKICILSFSQDPVPTGPGCDVPLLPPLVGLAYPGTLQRKSLNKV